MPANADKSLQSVLPLDVSLLPCEGKLLVACSGGADSTALLLSLHHAGYSCVGAHVNHGTRGAESDGDEEFVRQLCIRLKIPFAAARCNFPSTAGEAELRDARYSALLGLAREYACASIVTGHTANDNLETILMNWLRGASVSGFAGIPPKREVAPGLLLLRPLLDATRDQVREFLTAHGEFWQEDSSNASAQYLRNRVRAELLPLLAELGGDENQLALQTQRASQIQRDDLAFLDTAASEALESCTLHASEALLILDAVRFRCLPVALQRRILRLAAQRLEDTARDIGVARVEEVREHILQNRRRAVWQWRKNLRVEWTGEYSGNRIRFMRV